nr:immunoglobulin heavy chain junction region [Mus musculus]
CARGYYGSSFFAYW